MDVALSSAKKGQDIDEEGNEPTASKKAAKDDDDSDAGKQ
jgi:hypothetical protein